MREEHWRTETPRRKLTLLDLLVFGLSILGILAAVAGVALVFSGCAERGSFPGAKSADVIACRDYASHYGALHENRKFNECMEEAGYAQR